MASHWALQYLPVTTAQLQLSLAHFFVDDMNVSFCFDVGES